ncbi:hypothetical protein HQN89_23275 [Paenibacillus frigoriresistens]|nr:hypothetical protein [Paenibacillus frigoriresistens]
MKKGGLVILKLLLFSLENKRSLTHGEALDPAGNHCSWPNSWQNLERNMGEQKNFRRLATRYILKKDYSVGSVFCEPFYYLTKMPVSDEVVLTVSKLYGHMMGKWYIIKAIMNEA